MSGDVHRGKVFAVGLGTLQSRGQVTIPADVRRSAGLAPGDVLVFRVAGPGKLEATVLRRHASMAAVFERYGRPGTFDPKAWSHAMDDMAADVLRNTTDTTGPGSNA